MLDEPSGQTGGELATPEHAMQSLQALKQSLMQRGEATDLFAKPRADGLTGIESCEFPKFGNNEIKEYSEQLGLLFDGVIFNLGKIRTLQSLRDTLLPKLMSGEVRVQYAKEAE